MPPNFIPKEPVHPLTSALCQLQLVSKPSDPVVSQSITDVLRAHSHDPSAEARLEAAKELAAYVREYGVSSFEVYGIREYLQECLADAKSAGAREFALLAVTEVCTEVGAMAEAFLLPLLSVVLEKLADKQANVRQAAETASAAMIRVTSSLAVTVVLDHLYLAMESSQKWQVKVAALQLLSGLCERSAELVRVYLPNVIPHVTDTMWDTNKQVQQAAVETMKTLYKTVDNGDIEPFIPDLVGCIARPEEVPECIYKLAATTFVKQVDAPALAIMTPLLIRGLAERKTAILRQTAVIIDNMCKLVENPVEAECFLPMLLPGLEKVVETAADPECRNVATKAHKTLLRARGEQHIDAEALKQAEATEVLATLKQTIEKKAKSFQASATSSALLSFVAALLCPLIDTSCFRISQWELVLPYLTHVMSEADAKAVVADVLAACKRDLEKRQHANEVEEEGEDLCNCDFSLAYGGMILLNNANLRLKRGKRYALCGPNGAGKSTLMRAIANGQVEGFPSPDELKTVYVEHNLQASEAEYSVLEFIMSDKSLNVVREEVIEMLGSVGFTESMQAQVITSLSGGWKMKLELARAMLMKADILLLDEPTNHLDVANVAWLENYLTSLDNVTSIVVSHDSKFIDTVCTHVIHYENRKLRTYIGNLSELIKVRPEAKTYYELAEPEQTFVFPEPGFLEGVKSKDKKILKMTGVGFQYPTSTIKNLHDINLMCCLSSRVAVLGPNGAGKSTLIKVLTGELKASEGEVWKHPNLRIAYVAQHAFHHLENHLDKTPNQYIQWRYQYGEDKEDAQKVYKQYTDEEKKLMAKPIVIEGEKRVVESLESRRKLKKSYEYEVKWVNKPYEMNTWLPRDKLETLGFTKMIREVDDREAALAGAQAKPLTAASIEKHLKDVGLDPEFATHRHIRGLSGGQKVKVVIAAAMWNNPHMLVLDEPTNYLDRDSLAALASAIKSYNGGVIMISHHREFTDALCTEKWHVTSGQLLREGEAPVDTTKIEQKLEEETTDAFGNKVVIKQKRSQLSRKEIKQMQKRIKDKIKKGEALDSDEEEEALKMGV
jgi:elongation factor 3